MEPIPWELLRSLSPWALVSLAVIGLFRGWLMPRSTVQLLTQRADDYKAAWQMAEEARRVDAEANRVARELQGQQLERLLKYAETADAVLRSLPAGPIREPA